MRQRGATLTEIMVVTMILLTLGSAFYGVYTVSFNIHDKVIGQNNAYADGRAAVDLMADHIRNAQLNTNTGSGVLNSVLAAGTATSITYYADSTGTEVRYRLNGTDLERLDAGVTTIAARNIQSLTLTYYTLSSYNGTWAKTTDANAPTSTELLSVAGVEIVVTVARDGYTTEYKSLVRLRNSPRKHKLSGL